MTADGSPSELAAVEKRIAENEPAEAQPVREIRAVITEIATQEHPQSLAELRRKINARNVIPPGRSGLLQYVLMDMLDRGELEISEDRHLIVRLAA